MEALMKTILKAAAGTLLASGIIAGLSRLPMPHTAKRMGPVQIIRRGPYAAGGGPYA